MNVGVMKDYKLRDLRASHTPVGVVKSFGFFFLVFLLRPDGFGSVEDL